MKKTLTLLISLLLCAATFAQNVTTIWEKSNTAGNYPDYLATSTVERGLAYYNDTLYVASRAAGVDVILINATTGEKIGNLNTEGIAGGTYPINDVEVSDDGVIFACNLTTDASGSVFKVYRWDNDLAKPSVVIEYRADVAYRFGDRFAVTGAAADNSLTIWATDAKGNKKVAKFTTSDNGTSFSPEIITLSAGALSTFAVVIPSIDGTELYGNSFNMTPSRYKADGTYIDEIPAASISGSSHSMKTFAIGGANYLVAYNYAAKTNNVKVLDITDSFAGANLLGTTVSMGDAGNSGAGDVAVKDNGDGTYTVFALATNNGIAAYKFTPPSQVATPEFSPASGTFYGKVTVSISSATAGAQIYYTTDATTPDSSSASTAVLYEGEIELTDTTVFKAIAYADGMEVSEVDSAYYDVVPVVEVKDIAALRAGTQDETLYKLTGEVVLTYQQDFRGQKYIQDSSAAVLVDDDAKIIKTAYEINDGITGMIGKVSAFGGMIQFTPAVDPGAATSQGNEIKAQTITFAEFKTNFEDYEGELVTLENAKFLDLVAGTVYANGKTYPMTDGVDTVVFRTTFYNVDYIGSEIPETKVNITGIPNSRTDGIYISPRNFADLGVLPPEPDTLLNYWVQSEANGNLPSFFGAGTERGLAYGKVGDNERLYVVSRSSGAKVIILNANNGEVLGELQSPSSQVGLFPLNDVEVSEDGKIFACNLTLDAQSGKEFVIYMWEDEDSEPRMILNYAGGMRLGDLFSVSGSVEDNSLVIWAGKASGENNAVKVYTDDNGFEFKYEDVQFNGLNQKFSPNFQVARDGSIWAKSFSGELIHFDAEYNAIDTVSADVAPTGINKIEYVDLEDTELIIGYNPCTTGEAGLAYASVIDVTEGGKKAVKVAVTPSLGKTKNYGTGDVAFKMVDTTGVIYALGTGNGIGAFSTDSLKADPLDVEEIEGNVPTAYSLAQNYPNPFNPTTTINFTLPKSGMVTLKVYDILGQEVATLLNEVRNAGSFKVNFDASRLTSGMYIYTIKSGNFVATKKMMLVK